MQKKFWIVNKVDSTTAEILVYGYIGMDDVSASDFVRELRNLEKEFSNINVRINSGGGSIYDGFAIFNAMRNSKAFIETFIDGVAASMGTVIALGGKKCHMSKVARFMTHRASGFACGNADEMRQNAELLEGLENSISTIYSAKTGQTIEQCKVKYLGNTDKWFTAEQALAEKLIDSIYDGEEIGMEVPNNANEKEMWSIFNANTRFAAQWNPEINNNNMKQIFLSPSLMAVLGISENTTDQGSFEAKVKELSTKAANADQLQIKINDLTAQLSSLKTADADREVTAMLSDALNKEKKITKELRDVFATQYKGKPQELKSVLDTLQPMGSVVKNLKQGGDKTKFEGKTFDELDEAGLLAAYRAADEQGFFDMWKSEFGKKHRDDKS